MREIEWRALRGSAVLLVLALVLGGAAAGVAIRFHDHALREFAAQATRLGSIRSRYGAIDEQRRLIEAWLPAFRALQAEGIIGDEPRLAWIETLREAAAGLGLPALRYRIERRTPYEAAADLATGALRPFSTVVRLDAGLLHEGDLVRLLGEIATRGAGLHRVERCDVRRAAPTFVMRAGAVNLAAECDLRWITLARVEAQP